jgi:hypothetical protein
MGRVLEPKKAYRAVEQKCEIQQASTQQKKQNL